MLEILILLVVFGVGFYVGESLFAYRIRHLIYKEAMAQGIELDLPISTKPNIAKLFVYFTRLLVAPIVYYYNLGIFPCLVKCR